MASPSLGTQVFHSRGVGEHEKKKRAPVHGSNQTSSRPSIRVALGPGTERLVAKLQVGASRGRNYKNRL